MSRSWAWYARLCGGIGVLCALATFAVMLLPPYLHNFQFQQFLEQVIRDPQRAGSPDAVLEVAVLDKAAQLGLPVKSGQIRITHAGDQTRIEVLYFVRVDLPLYTVDLHFRPAAGD